jgi:VCBS repeat-containing protein
MLTIDPTSNLSESVQYFVIIPNGAIRDLAGNNFVGINTYDFTANASPIATGSSLTTNEDTGKTGALAGTDAEGSALTFVKVTDPTNGTVTINPSTGAYTYTPKANYNGSDSFTFKVNDGTVDSETSTVSITVLAVNDTPTGSVSLSGTATQGQILTAANTFGDIISS